MVFGQVRGVAGGVSVATRFISFVPSVATGVQHFKSGDNKAAMRYYNHALEIDSNNVEGLVARGAL